MSEKTIKPVLTESIKVTVDTVKNRFVGFDGNSCTAGTKALGVSVTDADSGEVLPVMVIGIALVEAGGSISVGGAVASDSNGKAITATSSETINGYALDSAVASGDIIRVKLV